MTGESSRPSRDAIAEVETVGNQPLHAQELGQRTHHVIEPLTDEHDVGALGLQSFEARQTIGFQVRLQLVLEVFVTQQVEAVPAHTTQYGVHHPGGKNAVRIQKRTHHRNGNVQSQR